MGSRGILEKNAFYPVFQVASHQKFCRKVGMGVHQHFLRCSLQMIHIMAEVKELVNDKIEGYLVVHVHDALIKVDRQRWL